jgi:biotin-dependent carboxylase-like uncharacterized protein
VIEIVKPGPLSSVQDAGRTGYRHLGVGAAGAMDELALSVANLMLGNDEGAAAIEVTLGGIELRFTGSCAFAVAGADAGFTLDGEPIPGWWAATACAGQVLRAAAPRFGLRSYIAFSGGVDVAPVLGARATDLKAGFGGFAGRALAAGDRLPLGKAGKLARPFGLAAGKLGLSPAPAERDAATVLRIVPAAEWEDHDGEMQALFLSTEWKVDPASNRVGIRLTGPPIRPRRPRELVSHGILPGTVQLPPSGMPIVQMRDANTVGGYPKLGVVIAPDLRLLAQTRLGGRVRFVMVSRAEALEALRHRERLLERIRVLCEMARMLSGGKVA